MRRAWLIPFALPGLLLSEASAMETVLRQDGTLPSTLILREVQSGFAGETATVVVIRPDGAFCRWRELNRGLMGEARSGRLERDQLAEMAATLARHDVATLPGAHGEVPRVNPGQLILSFDGRQSVFALPVDDSAADAAAPAARMAAIRRAIIDAVDNASPAPVDDCPPPG